MKRSTGKSLEGILTGIPADKNVTWRFKQDQCKELIEDNTNTSTRLFMLPWTSAVGKVSFQRSGEKYFEGLKPGF